MITYKIIPAHILRLYIWQLLSQYGAMSTIPVKDRDTPTIVNLVPIIPVEDEPKVADSDKAYAIYGYAESASAKTQQIREGSFTLRIIAPDFAQLTHIINIVSLAFESSDIATEAVNRFSSSYGNGAGVLEGIRFTDALATYTEGGEAPESEGAAMEGVINISYGYINRLTTPIVSGPSGLWS